MLKYPTWAQDEGTLLVFPSLMLKGATPNHTFLSIYGPANLYALTAAFFVAGQSVFVERLVAVFYHLVLVGSLTALVWRRRGLFAGVAAGAITVVVGVSYPMMAFAWLGGIAFVSLGLLLLDVGLGGRSRRLVVALAGLSLGLAISFRADLSVAVLLILMVLAANRRRAAVFLLPGLLLGLIPTIVSMVQVGPVAVFEDEIVKPVFVIAPQVRLPLPSLGSATGLLMVLCLVIPVVEIVVGTLGWRRSHGAWDDVCVVIVGVVGLSIISNMLHRADLTHIGFVATFTVATAVLVDWTRIAPRLDRAAPLHGGDEDRMAGGGGDRGGLDRHRRDGERVRQRGFADRRSAAQRRARRVQRRPVGARRRPQRTRRLRRPRTSCRLVRQAGRASVHRAGGSPPHVLFRHVSLLSPAEVHAGQLLPGDGPGRLRRARIRDWQARSPVTTS